MFVVTRYTVPVAEGEQFLLLARPALEALTARPGCLGGRVGRSADDPTLWVLSTTWAGVGAYRRALSAYEVKLHAVPLMYRAIDEPTAFEDVLTVEQRAGGAGAGLTGITEHAPSRAADADTVNLGEASQASAPRDLA